MNAAQRRRRRRYLLNKWEDAILKEQVRERFNGHPASSAMYLARRFESAQKYVQTLQASEKKHRA